MRKNSSRRANTLKTALGRRPAPRRETLRPRHSRQWLFEKLEDRRLLATLYVDNPVDFLVTIDQGAPGLDNGDEVTWTPGAGSAHGGPQAGLIYGTDAFGTIGSAIIAAAPLDTIRIAGGSFVESINVNKQLTLLGNQNGVDAQDPARTGLPATETVVGNNVTTSVSLTASDVILDGFTIEGATSSAAGFGVALGAGTSGAEIRNNIIQNNVIGLSLANSSAANPATIERNLFRTNNNPGAASGHGIYTDQFSAGGTLNGAIIDNNTFQGNAGQGIGFSSTDVAQPATNITISDNLFTANGRAMYAFSLTSSQFIRNTVQGSTAAGTADLRLFEGVSNLLISENVLQNGAGRAVVINANGGTGMPAVNNVTFTWNSVTGYTGPASTFQLSAGAYTGTLNATRNWWGSITGPTTAANPGGTGTTLADPDGVVDFQPWLVYGTDAAPTTPGFQLPTSYTVPAQVAPFTPTNNNYRRLVNMIEGLQPGQTVTLIGLFDWTETEAAAAWALGNDGVVSAADDYSLLVPAGINNVTITAASVGSATIQGPGDVATANLEGVFNFDGGDNQNWTLSNLEILDFDLAIGMFNGAGGSDAYNNTQILNNHIRIPADLNATAAPVDVNQNIGLHYSFGTNQTIQGNVLDIVGTGVSAGATFSTSVGMQSNTSGGTVYDGLLIDGNTLNVLGVQSATPANILGIWENAHAHSSDITVSNNTFQNLDAGNNPALNLQRAFRVTSHSSASTFVTYSGNTVSGANTGFQWLAASNFAGNQAVRLWENTLTNTDTAVLVQSSGVANLYRNTITGSLTAGLNIASGNLTSSGPILNAVEQNFITGGGAGIVLATGVVVANPIFNNDLSGNTGLALDNQSATLVDASGNWWGSNTPVGVVAEIGGLVDYTPWLDVGTDTSADPGFQGDFSTLHVDDTSPQATAAGRIQEAIDLATGSAPTVIIEAGTYAENVAANKAGLVLDGATGVATDVVIDPPGVTDAITVTANNVTIRDLRVTGAANALIAANQAILTLANVEFDGNTSGGSLTNIATVNFTASPIGDAIAVSGTQFSESNLQAVALSGTTTFNAFGDDGSDTFTVIPSATMTINIDGDLPTPPASPGDTLIVNTAGTGNPTLTSTSTPSGLQGSYTFSDRAAVNFQEIESLDTNADLVVTKTDTPDPVTAGTTLTYTITLSNVGGVAADGVTLTDAVPAGTTFTSFTAPAGWSITTPAVGGTGTITATNPSVAAGSGPIAFTLVVTVNASTLAGTILSNTATATSTTPEETAADNTDTETTTVIASADLSVTKTDSPDPVTAGTNLTYTIVVTNNGVSDAQGVSLSDLLPAGTTFVSFTAPAGWTATTPAVGGTGTVTATNPTLPAGSGPQTFALVVAVASAVANGSVLSNTAAITTTTTDSVPANNSDTEITVVLASADLSVTKTDSADPVIAGQNLTYTIVVTNNGTSDAQGVNLSDVIPAGTTFVSFTAPAGWTNTTPAVGGTGPISSTRPTLAAGSGPQTFTLVVNVNANVPTGANVTNTAVIGSTTSDPLPANNSDTETTATIASADLSVTKTDTPDPVIAGQNVTYTIVVTNSGSSDAQGVSLTDLVPAGTTFVSFTAPAGWTSTTPAVGGTGTISSTRPTLAAGATATFTLVVTTSPLAANGTIVTNTATVASTTTDPTPANNADTETTTIVTSADLSLTKTDNADPVTAGQDITYTIVVTNLGVNNAQGVSLTDLVPTGTTFVSFTAPAGWTTTTPAVGGTGTVGATIATLPAGSGAQTFTLIVRVPASTTAGTTVTNTATVASTTADPVPANNTDTETTAVVTSADVSVTKTDNADPVVAGQNLTYTIVVSNLGLSDAQGISLNDLIPAGTTFVSFTAPAGWTSTTPAVGGTGTVTSTTSTLAAGAVATFTLVVQVPPSATAATVVSNTATVTTTSTDPNAANNTDTETTAVVRPGLADCEVETLNVPGAPGTAVIVPDADNPGQFALVITGTGGLDVITVDPRFGFPGQITVRRNGLVVGNFATSQFQRIVVFAQDGNDFVAINALLAPPAKIFGGNGNDQLIGGSGDDGIAGGNGIDFVFGGEGNDTLCGGDGSDVLHGQGGNDTMGGDEGIDTLFGDGGADQLLGGDGIDFLYGGSGNDELFGQAGNDVIHGQEGNDIASAGSGSDVVSGGSDRDIMLGGTGADVLLGDQGDDIVVAGPTTHDTDEAALNALLAEWISGNSYTNRVNNIRTGGGANGLFVLNSTTVADDGQLDLLWGFTGQDWFLFGIGDSVLDKAANELVN